MIWLKPVHVAAFAAACAPDWRLGRPAASSDAPSRLCVLIRHHRNERKRTKRESEKKTAPSSWTSTLTSFRPDLFLHLRQEQKCHLPERHLVLFCFFSHCPHFALLLACSCIPQHDITKSRTAQTTTINYSHKPIKDI